MKKEYFEMNELDSTHSIDTDKNAYRQSKNPPEKTSVYSENVSVNDTNSYDLHKEQIDSEVNKIKIIALAISLIGVLLIAGAAALILGLFRNGQDEAFDGNYDLKETVFVTDSDRPGIDLISENVLGTGMLFEDCDILTRPEEGSTVEGRLAGGTDVLIYSAEGDYYKVSDAERNVEGYVLKEKVNTGNIDLGNPDEEADIVDDATGRVIGREKPSSKVVTSTTVNPEDFPVNASPYFIYVEKGSHTITIFGKDANGKYTVPRKTFLTATGRTASLTPVGDFTILGKEKWHSWGKSYSPYCCKYYGNLFFHGPIYGQKNFGTLSINSVFQIGTNASSGCMRTTVQAAYFIYQFCWVGTNVKIVNGSPLGRSANLPSYWTQYVDPATNLVPAAGISFGFDGQTMNVGDSIRVTAEFTPSTASNKDCTWSCTNPGVVSVSGDGENCTLSALKEGSAVITVCSIDGGYTASFTVTVLAEESEDISSQEDSSAESDETSSTLPDDVSSVDVSSQEDSSQEVSSQEDSSQEISSQDNASHTSETQPENP